MVDEAHRPVLQDHIKVKRKLVPFFVNKMGRKMSQYSWTRQLVPEALWLGLVIKQCGYEAARSYCGALGQAAVAATNRPDGPMFAKFSAFAQLSEAEKNLVKSTLDRNILWEISRSLAPLTAVMPNHPLAFLMQAPPEEKEKVRLPDLLREFYDRNSRAAVLSSAIGYEMGLDQRKLHIAEHLIDEVIAQFRVIGRYPDTDESRRAAGAFRASASMLFKEVNLESAAFADDAPWVTAFWDNISGFGPCLLPDTLEDESTESDDNFEQFIFDYRNAVRADLRARLANWSLDLNEVEVFEVVTALLCRQATLAIDMASSPGAWTPHTAPILLRAIADVFINLAWILKHPRPRARMYIEDGQGAIKLQIAHQKRALEATTDQNDANELRQMIDLWSDWLAAQRLEVFVEVNLGSWSGLNTRKMAEEAGFLEFYNYVYQPFSWVVHSNWAHVSMFNTAHCENPAHRWHRGAAIAQVPIDLNWLYLASKYFDKTLRHFDDVHGLLLPHATFDLFTDKLTDTEEDARS